MRCSIKYLKESINELVDWWKKALDSKGIDLVKMSNRLHNTHAWWYWLVQKRLDWCRGHEARLLSRCYVAEQGEDVRPQRGCTDPQESYFSFVYILLCSTIVVRGE